MKELLRLSIIWQINWKPFILFLCLRILWELVFFRDIFVKILFSFFYLVLQQDVTSKLFLGGKTDPFAEGTKYGIVIRMEILQVSDVLGDSLKRSKILMSFNP